MTNSAVRGWLSLFLLLLAVYGSYTLWRVYRAKSRDPLDRAVSVASETQEPARPLADFTFTERSGRRLNLGSLKGDVWVASFFFASCPGFCRQMNQQVAALHSELAPLGVKFVSITVDPANDTPKQLRTYAKEFGAGPDTWLFLTGKMDDVRALGTGFLKVSVEGQTHTDKLVIVDRAGKVRGWYSSRDAVQVRTFKAKVRDLVAERPGKVPS